MHISGVQKKPEDASTAAQTKTLKDTDYIVLKDMKKAFQFAYKACELRNMYACANLSQMYKRGDGIEKNEKEAEKYKKLALEMQEEMKKQQETLTFQQGVGMPNWFILSISTYMYMRMYTYIYILLCTCIYICVHV